MNKRSNFEITEIFMAKADWKRTFIGILTRKFDDTGTPILIGRIPVKNNIIISQAYDSDDLGKNLDDIVRLVLDHNILESKPSNVQLN